MRRNPAFSRPYAGGFIVAAQPSWQDVAQGTNELRIPFETRDAALAYARVNPWPIVDVIDRSASRVIAVRRMPDMPLTDTIAEG